MEKTSTGLAENVAGLLSYVLWWVSGIVFILIERENKFVRFHAIGLPPQRIPLPMLELKIV